MKFNDCKFNGKIMQIRYGELCLDSVVNKICIHDFHFVVIFHTIKK